MKLVVGLGNPGPRYALTRHNAGFMAVDRLAKRLETPVDRIFFNSLVGQGVLAGEKIILAKPQTYMNLSGQAVVALLNWYKLAPADLIVIYDDLDLPPGRLRIRDRGSAGGHRGMASIISLLGTGDFIRVRIGIGRPPVPGPEVADWVLARPAPEDMEAICRVLETVPGVVEEIVRAGVVSAMNKFNGWR
ncbi:aminoacyl-tRNA hydrolase [Desulfallas thermosapovorans]|uniref:Peptidyl-tRNA hydrolase n=1 Tax=Desulfallas thermosapovorans DSM 6562 TaxID=1121431 RepID=A0A5S4ZXJ7_9FIRM|nr:aminoacyl-tRNA hydrolase [Desulfallas thermosapovorans]TYO96970.1 peptidyl-tRNA hydrolase [Desulfallas thermosapovorans DSM 6562]